MFRILTLLFIGMVGCTVEVPKEIEETDQVANTSLTVISELISTFDIVQDFVQHSDVFFKKDEILLPSTVLLYPIDTSFLDGDGISVVLDFGDLGATPHGVLCKDKKYRAGRIVLELTKPYTEIDAKLKVKFEEEFPFYSGDGQTMTAFNGQFTLLRASVKEILLHSDGLKLETKDVEQILDADVSINLDEDNGAGILNDVMSFEGVLTLSNGVSETIISTLSALQKNYTLDCVQNIVSGEMDIDLSASASEVLVDFDPDNNMACDNIVELTVNGKSVRHEY